jgi:calcineurin-like phosphoesterase family protein
VDEMHNSIIENFNAVVSKDDVVFYLGDLSFCKGHEKSLLQDMVNKLNGEIHYILGNHDKFEDIKKLNRFKTINDYVEVKITHLTPSPSDSSKMVLDERLFCCMHYPIYACNKAHHGAIMLHGHSHMALSNDELHTKNRIIDVGCMGYDYKPVSYSKIIEMADKIDYKLNLKHH